MPDALATVASDVAGIGVSLSTANAVAAAPTTTLLAAVENEVSAAIATVFGAHARKVGMVVPAAPAKPVVTVVTVAPEGPAELVATAAPAEPAAVLAGSATLEYTVPVAAGVTGEPAAPGARAVPPDLVPPTVTPATQAVSVPPEPTANPVDPRVSNCQSESQPMIRRPRCRAPTDPALQHARGLTHSPPAATETRSGARRSAVVQPMARRSPDPPSRWSINEVVYANFNGSIMRQWTLPKSGARPPNLLSKLPTVPGPS
ncbi:PE family protein [Mycobacterium kansasii 732]|nr:PE family protein [Mycobacterium kansasii 732]